MLSEPCRATLLAAGGFSATDVGVLAASGLGSGVELDELPREVSKRASGSWRRLRRSADWRDRVGRVQQFANHPDTYLCSAEQPIYPPLLSEIPDAPGVLMVRGTLESLVVPGAAVVGSRDASPGAERFALELGRALGHLGVPVVSGLARGIDAAALRGAVEAGGPTVAVMGRGLDDVYPATNRSLAERMLVDGAWASEFPPGTPPRREHFPQRNRVVSGLARAVVVVEAAVRSGSLITARFALEQSREVFAVPGSVWNARARGCHALVRDGAAIVLSVEDLIEELLAVGVSPLRAATLPAGVESPAAEPDRPSLAEPSCAERESMGGDASELLPLIGYEPTPVAVLEDRLGWPAARLRQAIVRLEIAGFVQAERGGYSRLPFHGP